MGDKRGSAFTVVLIYAIVSALWILFSDTAVRMMFDDPEQIIRASVIKGWLFVAVTTLLLYGLVRNLLHRTEAAHRREVELYAENQRTLQLLQAITDNTDDAIFAKDADRRYIFANPAAVAMAGVPLQQGTGRTAEEIFPGPLAEQTLASDQRVLAGNTLVRLEEHLPVNDGIRVIDVTKGPLHDGAGKIAGLFGIARDITARKAAEDALRASEAKFRALVEQSMAGIYIIGPDRRLRYVNPGFAAIFGFESPEALIDTVPVSDLVAPEYRERVAENLRLGFAGEIDSSHYAFRGLRRDGQRIDVEANGRIFEYRGQKAAIGFLTDVSATRRAQEAVLQSERRFNDIVRATGDWVWEVDADARYIYASDGVFDLLGYRPDEVIGKTPFDFMPSEEATRVRSIFTAIASKRRPFRDLDNINVRKDGRSIDVSTSGIPVIGADGVLQGYRGLDRDVTANVAAAGELRRRNEELERFNRAAIGRELDIIELKKQINQLAREAGREAPFPLAFLKGDASES